MGVLVLLIVWLGLRGETLSPGVELPRDLGTWLGVIVAVLIVWLLVSGTILACG